MTLADTMLFAAVLVIAAVPPAAWWVFGDGREPAVALSAQPPAEEPEVTQDDVDELIRRILEADAER